MRVMTIPTALVLVLAGCGGDDQPSAEPANTTAEIVGSWQRITTCEERVRALKDAGLGQFALSQVAGVRWIPEGRIIDPRHPCKGAVPLKHGHFFTEDGLFGSTDAQGDQVDDGTYRVIAQDTIVIEKEFGDVTFDYRIDDDALFLDPVMPECTETGCFTAQWAVAVAYPGLPWNRVD